MKRTKTKNRKDFLYSTSVSAFYMNYNFIKVLPYYKNIRLCFCFVLFSDMHSVFYIMHDMIRVSIIK